MALTREQILARKVAGKTQAYVQDGEEIAIVRGLTRDEVLQVRDVEGLADKDSLMISLALVEPQMSLQDVQAWAASDDAGTLTGISDLISEMSRLSEGAGKSRVPRTRRRS